jgi:hypothetical protein
LQENFSCANSHSRARSTPNRATVSSIHQPSNIERCDRGKLSEFSKIAIATNPKKLVKQCLRRISASLDSKLFD